MNQIEEKAFNHYKASSKELLNHYAKNSFLEPNRQKVEKIKEKVRKPHKQKAKVKNE